MFSKALLVLSLTSLVDAVQVSRFSLPHKPEHEVAAPPIASHIAELTPHPRPPHKSAMLKAARGAASFTDLTGASGDTDYIAPVTIGDQHFQLFLDTGSSDTWLVEQNFQCVDQDTGRPISRDSCGFGIGYDAKKSKTFKEFARNNFNVTYDDGTFANGPIGFETITVAGLTVKNQIFGYATHSAWVGDGVSSGLLGLAYPDLTSLFHTSNPVDDDDENQVLYQPFFFTGIREKAIAHPLISLALNRGSLKAQEGTGLDKRLGILGFGGVVPVKTTNVTTTVPVRGVTASGAPAKSSYSFYAVGATYHFHGAPALKQSLAFLDSGTTLNMLPSSVAKAYNAAFKPPARFDNDSSTYIVECNATPPAFSVEINGVSFPISAKDQILAYYTDSEGKEICQSGTQDGGDPSDPDVLFVLGTVFLHNVVATFNLAANSIHLAEREKY